MTVGSPRYTRVVAAIAGASPRARFDRLQRSLYLKQAAALRLSSRYEGIQTT
jgi:hypothetical protein